MIYLLLLGLLVRGQEEEKETSSKTCQELGWSDNIVKADGDGPFDGGIGVEGVCGQKEADCEQGTTTWDDADSFCKDIGARLCTDEEYKKLESASNGCDLDDQLVWTATRCSSTKHTGIKILEGGKSFEEDCFSDKRVKATYAGRCCADMGEVIQITKRKDDGSVERVIPCPLSRVDSAIVENVMQKCDVQMVDGQANPGGPDFLADGSICAFKGVAHESYCNYRMNELRGEDAGNCVRCKPPPKQECSCTRNNEAIPDDSTYKGSGYGVSCFAWDAQWDYCNKELLDAKGDPRPSYCDQKWCYVQEGCVISSAEDPDKIQALASTAFPGSGLFYSYQFCGDFDDTLINWGDIKFEPCGERNDPIDLYITVDASSSITDENWLNQMKFLSLLVELGTKPNDRVGFVQYSGKPPSTMYTFDDDRSKIINEIEKTAQLKGGTKTDEGLQGTIDQWDKESDMNDGRKKFMVLLTDGVPNPIKHNPCDRENSLNIVNQLTNRKIQFGILAVGMEAEHVGLLACLVESQRKNIVQMADFESFFQYRDPSGDNAYLCVDPDEFRDLPTNAPTQMVVTSEPTDAQTAEPTSAPTESVKPTKAPKTPRPTRFKTKKPSRIKTEKPTPTSLHPTSDPESPIYDKKGNVIEKNTKVWARAKCEAAPEGDRRACKKAIDRAVGMCKFKKEVCSLKYFNEPCDKIKKRRHCYKAIKAGICVDDPDNPKRCKAADPED